MKRLFVVGASVLQLPAIVKAKEMGLYTAAADYDPEAAGIAYADEYFNVSTVDEENIYRAAKEFGADGIVTLATDMPMRSVAYACERLGLPGISYETAVKATDKGEMIKAFDMHNAAHPRYVIVPKGSRVPQDVGFPCITKPTDNSGSRGVMLVRSKDELENAVGYSSAHGRSGNVIIEEYMEGAEVSAEVIAYGGSVRTIQITDKLTTGAPHFVEMGHSEPSRLDKKTCADISALAEKAVNAIGIKNSPAHVEIMVTPSGPKLVELGARLGGDCITTHLVPLSTGIDMVRAAIDLSLGKAPDITPKFSMGAAIRYFNIPEGKIERIDGIKDAEAADGIIQVSFTKKEGDVISMTESSADRAGFIIAQDSSAEPAAEKCAVAMKKINIQLSEVK